MKKTVLLFALLISILSFSQSKQVKNNSIEGINTIIRKNPWSESADKPLKDEENNPLIDQINKLEKMYLDKVLSKPKDTVNFNDQLVAKEKTYNGWSVSSSKRTNNPDFNIDSKSKDKKKVHNGWTVSSRPEKHLNYRNIKAAEVQQQFTKQDLSKLKNKDDVFKAYILYLKKKLDIN